MWLYRYILGVCKVKPDKFLCKFKWWLGRRANFTSPIIDSEWRNGGMKLFDKIRILRKARGLSQEQLGYSLSRVNKDGISRQTVSDWENGKFEPKLDNIRDLAEVFDVSFDTLLDESVDLDDPAVLKAVLNKRPYDNRDEFEEEQPVVEDVPSTFKSKRITSWRTAILMVISVSMILTGITWIYNFVEAAVDVNRYSSSTDNVSLYIEVILYGVIAFTVLSLSGVAFGFSLNAALRKNEARKAVVVLLIIAVSFYLLVMILMRVASIVNYAKMYERDINDYNDKKSVYGRIIAELVFDLVLTVLRFGGMLALMIFANKKLRANND